MSAIEFSNEQAMLLDIAARTLKDKWSIEQVRENLEHGPGYEPAFYAEMTEIGWPALAIPEALGGADQSLDALVPLVEPMGRHLLSGPFVSTQIAAHGLRAARSGAPDLADGWLGAIAEGKSIALALFEHDGSWEIDAATTCDDGPDGDVLLNGRKVLVHDLDTAAGALVSARTADGDTVIAAIEADELGACTVLPETLVDLTRRSSSVELSQLRVPAARVVRGEVARAAVRALHEAGWLLTSAEACGGIQGVLDVLLDYLKSRRQFGRHIGSYQSLKHPTVDILIGLERSRSLLYRAATLVGREGSTASDITEREIALRMAKAESTRAFVFASDRAIQFHGGVGFTWECDAQLYMRRALWCQAQWGDALHHRRRLADLIL